MADEVHSDWSDFFCHVFSFMLICNRQYGGANSSFTEYAIEHLNVILQGVNNIVDVIEEANVAVLIGIKRDAETLRNLLGTALNLWD